jgi:hypothetical protein
MRLRTSEQKMSNRHKEIIKAVADMTTKQQRVCAALKIPPQDYVIVMNMVHI